MGCDRGLIEFDQQTHLDRMEWCMLPTIRYCDVSENRVYHLLLAVLIGENMLIGWFEVKSKIQTLQIQTGWIYQLKCWFWLAWCADSEDGLELCKQAVALLVGAWAAKIKTPWSARGYSFWRRTNTFFLPICFTIFWGFGASKNVVLIVLIFCKICKLHWWKDAEIYSTRLIPLFQLIYTTCVQEDPEFQPVSWCGQVTCGQKFSKQWDCWKVKRKTLQLRRIPWQRSCWEWLTICRMLRRTWLSYPAGKGERREETACLFWWGDGKVESMCRWYSWARWRYRMGFGLSQFWNSPNSNLAFGVPVLWRLIGCWFCSCYWWFGGSQQDVTPMTIVSI